MFESDDFDEVLSQFELPDEHLQQIETSIDKPSDFRTKQGFVQNSFSSEDVLHPTVVSSNYNIRPGNSTESPKHSKRKIINSHFDHKSKRKFPGPAGLLSGNLEDNKDESVSHIELLSQDVNFTQNHIFCHSFNSPLWTRLTEDIKGWNVASIDTISSIKHQEISGRQRRKAHTVTALVETVDRSATDPLVILRDKTGHIKCTLHRDAWSTFSSYIVPENCALVLWKPTILRTGSAFKKYYLNITLGNILALYSSVMDKENEEDALPAGFRKTREEDVTVIKSEKEPSDTMSSLVCAQDENGLLDDLDNMFSDDLF